MSERNVTDDNLRTGAQLAGKLLAGWAVVMTVISLTDHTTIGQALRELGLSHWVMPGVLVVIAVLQLWGHGAQSRRILIVGDLLGGFVCMMGASVAGYAAMHGGYTASTAVNWGFVACMFLLHTVMLRQTQ